MKALYPHNLLTLLFPSSSLPLLALLIPFTASHWQSWEAVLQRERTGNRCTRSCRQFRTWIEVDPDLGSHSSVLGYNFSICLSLAKSTLIQKGMVCIPLFQAVSCFLPALAFSGAGKCARMLLWLKTNPLQLITLNISFKTNPTESSSLKVGN